FLFRSEPEVTGLLALMLLIESRRAARTTADGALVLLADQDRDRWDRALVAEGPATAPGRTRSRRPSTPSTATPRPPRPPTGGRSWPCTTSSWPSPPARWWPSTGPWPWPRGGARMPPRPWSAGRAGAATPSS